MGTKTLEFLTQIPKPRLQRGIQEEKMQKGFSLGPENTNNVCISTLRVYFREEKCLSRRKCGDPTREGYAYLGGILD